MTLDDFPAGPLLEDAIKFSSRELQLPYSKEDVKASSREQLRKLGDFGLYSLTFDTDDGTGHATSSDICDVLEGLGAGTNNNGLLFSAGAHLWAVIKPIFDFGTEQQKEKFLPSLFSGTAVGAHAASEPDSGSDIMSMKTYYKKVEGGYLINGAKAWITNAPIADYFLVFATCNPKLHFRGISAFIVPAGTKGIEVICSGEKMGLESSPMGSVFFDNCFVPSCALLGKEKQAHRIFQHSLTWERAFILGPALGAIRRQIKASIEYANYREQFGQKIGKFQAVSHRVVDMYLGYWQSRQVFRKAAYELIHRDNPSLASVAKTVLSNVAVSTHLDALKTFGGAGYLKEAGVEHDIRDSLGGQIYSGTSDLQKNIIASNLGL